MCEIKQALSAGAESHLLSLYVSAVYLHFCTWVNSSGSFGTGEGAGTVVSSPLLPLIVGSDIFPRKALISKLNSPPSAGLRAPPNPTRLLTGLQEGELRSSESVRGGGAQIPDFRPQADPPYRRVPAAKLQRCRDGIHRRLRAGNPSPPGTAALAQPQEPL